MNGMEGFLVGMWHYIVPKEGLPVKITGELCSLENFRSQLQKIKEKFNIVSTSTLIESIKKKEELPSNSLMLTFDDGTKDHYQVVLPVLQEMGLTATFFVLTAPLMGRIPSTFKLQLICGNNDPQVVRHEIFPTVLREHGLERYLENIESGTYYFELREIGEVKWTCNVKMKPEEKDVVIEDMFREFFTGEIELVNKMFLNKSEVTTLHQAGMTIGSHGVNHQTMSTLLSEHLERELNESKRFLEETLGSRVTTLGYPGCQPPKDIEKIREAGYLAAFACNINPPINRPPYDILALRRIHEKDMEKEFLK